jgi:predicted hydrocarbon binding protein
MDNIQSNCFNLKHVGPIVLSAMEEVIGPEGLEAVLRMAALPTSRPDCFPEGMEPSLSFETVSRLQCALEDAYGQRGGSGVALRVGRVCFKYGLHEFGAQLGLTGTDFRLLPFSAKLRVGSNSFAGLFNHSGDRAVHFEIERGQLLWHIEHCPFCWGRHTDGPACHLAIGLLQEFLYWISSGKMFQVEETRCKARGDEACTFLVGPTPLA